MIIEIPFIETIEEKEELELVENLISSYEDFINKILKEIRKL